MNSDVRYGLIDYFETLRLFSNERNWGCFFNVQHEMFGFLRAIYYAGVIDVSLYNKLFIIVNNMTIEFGK